jgi:hypothetical protein
MAKESTWLNIQLHELKFRFLRERFLHSWLTRKQ